jgi:hypothetical protein
MFPEFIYAGLARSPKRNDLPEEPQLSILGHEVAPSTVTHQDLYLR